MSKWLNITEGDYVIVVPEEDILPHGHIKKNKRKAELATFDCPCKPKVQSLGNGKLMIVHNSFDDLQKIEKSMKILK